MTRIILCGCCGKMGHFITQLVSERTDCEIVAGVDLNVNAQTASYPAYTSIDQVTEVADVIIDFSHPSLLTPILHYAAERVAFRPCSAPRATQQSRLRSLPKLPKRSQSSIPATCHSALT